MTLASFSLAESPRLHPDCGLPVWPLLTPLSNERRDELLHGEHPQQGHDIFGAGCVVPGSRTVSAGSEGYSTCSTAHKNQKVACLSIQVPSTTNTVIFVGYL